jgi:hypothetical protein
MAAPVTHTVDTSDVRRALATLEHAVGRLRARCTDCVGLDRLASDVRRVAEDLDLLGELAPAQARGDALPRVEFVQDTPYDPAVFQQADDEGLGGMRDAEKPDSQRRGRR